MIRYGDIDLLAEFGHATGWVLWQVRRRPGAIIILSAAVLDVVGITFFGSTRTTDAGAVNQSSGEIVFGAAFAILPTLLASSMLFTRPAVWQGVCSLLLGIWTFQAQVLLIVLGAYAGMGEKRAVLLLLPGYWLSLAGCVSIVVGGIVHLVHVDSPRR